MFYIYRVDGHRVNVLALSDSVEYLFYGPTDIYTIFDVRLYWGIVWVCFADESQEDVVMIA